MDTIDRHEAKRLTQIRCLIHIPNHIHARILMAVLSCPQSIHPPVAHIPHLHGNQISSFEDDLFSKIEDTDVVVLVLLQRMSPIVGDRRRMTDNNSLPITGSPTNLTTGRELLNAYVDKVLDVLVILPIERFDILRSLDN